jgi:hypothetical protein
VLPLRRSARIDHAIELDDNPAVETDLAQRVRVERRRAELYALEAHLHDLVDRRKSRRSRSDM